MYVPITSIKTSMWSILNFRVERNVEKTESRTWLIWVMVMTSLIPSLITLRRWVLNKTTETTRSASPRPLLTVPGAGGGGSGCALSVERAALKGPEVTPWSGPWFPLRIWWSDLCKTPPNLDIGDWPEAYLSAVWNVTEEQSHICSVKMHSAPVDVAQTLELTQVCFPPSVWWACSCFFDYEVWRILH